LIFAFLVVASAHETHGTVAVAKDKESRFR